LIEQEPQVAHEIARALTFANGANNHADPFWDVEVAQNFSEPVAFFRIFDLA
jgi:hypothetical protein